MEQQPTLLSISLDDGHAAHPEHHEKSMGDSHTPRLEPSESSPLLGPATHSSDADVESLRSSTVSTSKHALHASSDAVGERLPYNDYTTIDWLHDLVRDSSSSSSARLHQRQHLSPSSSSSSPFSPSPSVGVRDRLALWWDAAQGWFAAFAIGVLTAFVAYLVDVSVASLADWKEGRCVAAAAAGDSDDGRWMWWQDRERCGDDAWRPWVVEGGGGSWAWGYVIYVGVALVYGLVAGAVTTTTRANLPAVRVDDDVNDETGEVRSGSLTDQFTETTTGKMMYMAAGSGIPEIKTILSGFVIPHFLDFKVLVVKAVGAMFAVATGMCLGKEGPFVHISTCVGYLVAQRFPKYRDNGRRMREMLSVACSAGLSVAFGAPIGGVLFSYEVRATPFLMVVP